MTEMLCTTEMSVCRGFVERRGFRKIFNPGRGLDNPSIRSRSDLTYSI